MTQWKMHPQSIEEALAHRPRINPDLEKLKMEGAKRVANPNEVYFVWFENNYGSTECPPTEHGSLVQALERAAELDEEFDSDTDGDIYVIRGERINVKKRSEFVVDTD